jgi:Mg-chelatase subunit ChlI
MQLIEIVVRGDRGHAKTAIAREIALFLNALGLSIEDVEVSGDELVKVDPAALTRMIAENDTCVTVRVKRAR